MGQLLDEIAIIWVVMCAIALWFPKRHFPAKLNKSRLRFLQFLTPFLCHFVLLILVFVLKEPVQETDFVSNRRNVRSCLCDAENKRLSDDVGLFSRRCVAMESAEAVGA